MKQGLEIKGFTILELLVVIAIVGIISAIGIPNFLTWRQDRQVGSSAERLASLIVGINTQTQRGTYPFTQLLVTPDNVNETVAFVTKGKNKQTLATLLNGVTALSCNTADDDFWDLDPFNSFDAAGVQVHFENASAVCFSKNADNYEKTSSILGNTELTGDDGRSINNYIIICSSGATNCNTTPDRPAYMVEWSRFGNVSKYKYNGDEWIRQ